MKVSYILKRTSRIKNHRRVLEHPEMKVIFVITLHLLISDDTSTWQQRIMMRQDDIWPSLFCPFLPSIKKNK